MKSTATFILFFSVLFSPLSYAESYSKEYLSCIDNSGGVTAALLGCIADETDYQDKRLNAAYQKAMRTLPANEKQVLRTK
ncbi:lysozyme inhibitor LprI family protein [Neisseria sp.]|uniref:lysozyme inhibitor LprI family protein n=1 Tax=Neisseria sp. TaxID=192066 RepID=UPI00359FAB69